MGLQKLIQCEKFGGEMRSAGTAALSCVRLLAISWVSPAFSQKTECVKVNPCKCTMKDGSGVINLAAMGDSDGFLERDKQLPSSAGDADAEILYSFSPCHPFSEPPEYAPQCLNVAVCLILRYRTPRGEIKRFLNFGRHEDSEFSYNNVTDSLSVTYRASHSSILHTVVQYNCTSKRSVVLFRDPEQPNVLQINVSSPCACPNGCKPEDVGPGTIILIVFSISVAAYFLFGLCGLNPIRTPNGIELIPKENTWCSLCYACVERRGRNRPDYGSPS
ncbi:uncharacterized protein LOC103183040 [Callorhinchus milii]|uniref:Uncharacterized LOC103183040 n=1 Tax=Callorhinchus milii TaxID=7868 RepID=V9L5C7_CALMI|nr:uncharacterized protein LOC103183040 [Callorhinchus milii]|eukprot:gi/632964567/ref/XP_007898460.1/ PREDICTED: uncharacterized protein LOC103183040 [Callorhinchus milii]